MGPSACLDRCGKSRPHGDSIPGPSSQYPVAIPTELPGPQIDDWKEIQRNLPEGEKYQFVADTERFSPWDFFLSPQYSQCLV